MTPQDIINAAKEWRDANPGKRFFIVLTADTDARMAEGEEATTFGACVGMLSHMFASDPRFIEAAKAAIDNVEELIAKQLADELRKQFPKNIKS